MKVIKTQFGTLYARSGVGLGYQLLDSNKSVIQDYDNDMPYRWAENLKKCKSEGDFFATLGLLLNQTLVYETNKKRLIKEAIECFNDFTKQDILEWSCKVGKYNVFINYDLEF